MTDPEPFLHQQHILEMNTMTTEEVAERFGIPRSSVRSFLRRRGVREIRGYSRAAVEAARPKEQGHRSDLEKEGSTGE